MIRRMAVIAGVALFFLVSPAAAQYYQNPSITVVDPALQAGETVTVNGTCFLGTVSLLLDGAEIATGVAAADYTVTITAQVAAGTSQGDHQVSLQGLSCVDETTQVLSASITVGAVQVASTTTTTTTPTGNILPVTGSGATTPLAAGGAVLVGGGGLLLLASRKNKAADEA